MTFRVFVFFSLNIFFICFSVSECYSAVLDSLRTERIDGRLFVIHQIDEGETLYSLSRRYNVSIPKIVRFNPSAELSLDLGLIVRIPLPEDNVNTQKPTTTSEADPPLYHIVRQGEGLYGIARIYGVTHHDIIAWNNLTSSELVIGQKLLINKQKKQVDPSIKSTELPNNEIHILQPGETLYQLHKKYNVSLEQLMKWNNIDDITNIETGRQLIVSKPDKTVVNKNNTELISTPVKDSTTHLVDSPMHKTDNTLIKKDSAVVERQVENVIGFDEVVETGIAELMKGSDGDRKFLGLHRTVPIGTIIKVLNEMNDKMVYVRVIGRIPDTGDNGKVLLKISKAAYDRLGVLDPRFRVKLSYVP